LVFDPEESNFMLYNGDEVTISSSMDKNSIVFRMSPTKQSFVARFFGIKGGKTESKNAKIIETSQDGNWFQLAFTTLGEGAIIKILYEKEVEMRLFSSRKIP
jgi:hypothetical protein